MSALSQESLRPVDVVVALRLVLHPSEKYESLAGVLGVGVGSAHRSVKRLESAGLIMPHRRASSITPFFDFLVHGVRYAFYPTLGPEAPGVPTAHSGPPLVAEIAAERPIVWPSANGSRRGDTLVPLYDGATGLPKRDPALYEMLTLVDALRVGRARERQIAARILKERLRAGSAP